MGGRVLDAGREGGPVSGAGPGRGVWRPFLPFFSKKVSDIEKWETVQKKTSFRVKPLRAETLIYYLLETV